MCADKRQQHILVIISDAQIRYLLSRVLQSSGFLVSLYENMPAAQKQIETHAPDLIILDEQIAGENGLEIASRLLKENPTQPIILFVRNDTPDLLKSALRIGISDYLCLPLRTENILQSITNTIERSQHLRLWEQQNSQQITQKLQNRIDEFRALSRLGQSITSSLELDNILSAIIESAVKITGAEEGSLLLLDENTGELYMRAARNFQEDFVQTFRLPISDTLAGSVLRTGEPIILDENTPQKIKTSYLVQSLIYVPLKFGSTAIGVLGVDNRHSRTSFKEEDVRFMITLAEFAVIALVNSQLFAKATNERNKLETIITKIQDGVIVIDQDNRVILLNPTARTILRLPDISFSGQPINTILNQPEILEAILGHRKTTPSYFELSIDENSSFAVQIITVPDVGKAITMHDITTWKKLDHIKNEFVSTVSHDLRSPLTAILGYVELIERAGPVTDLQRDFIHRVQISVQNITRLVDDLVSLGRIEAGFDTRREVISLEDIIRAATENTRRMISDKHIKLELKMVRPAPVIYANPVQMRQMLEQIIDNACKFTFAGGNIDIQVEVEQNQAILNIVDSGIGIPEAELGHIFDKFYRGSNTHDVTGTGLGLTIVRSVIENHSGRVWVHSISGKGTTVTIVLPLAEEDFRLNPPSSEQS